MGIFSYFKKQIDDIKLKQELADNRSKQTLPLHLVNIKTKDDADLYVGQILSIEPGSGDNYYFYDYKSKKNVTNKISNKHQDHCEKYNYAIVRSVNGRDASIAIVCANGYLQRIKVQLNESFENGNMFFIKGDTLCDEKNKIAGTITDDRAFDFSKMAFNSLEDDILVTFFYK